jgi:hypothetical protein
MIARAAGESTLISGRAARRAEEAVQKMCDLARDSATMNHRDES